MEFVDGYILNPFDFRTGSLYISPFETNDAFVNREIWQKSDEDSNPVVNIDGKQFSVTDSATKALELILREMKLNPDDEIWIVTTSGNSYISGCVTRTIELVCKWNREISGKTAAILINHEFGFLYKDVENLRSYGLPIIEDRAYSMFSAFTDSRKNFTGDYIIYSMAKMFPMQSGGLLFSDKGIITQNDLSDDAIKYYKACFYHYYSQKEEIMKKRLSIYKSLTEAFMLIGIKPRFNITQNEIPTAFLFRAFNINLIKLKVFMQKQGIECSVFYGEDTFFIPCHQKMNHKHIDYIITLIKNFTKEHHHEYSDKSLDIY